MEKNRGTKVIAVVALLLGIVGLTLGFAAFSSILTIKSSAEVVPEDNFYVYFSSDNTQLTPDTTTTGTVTASPAYDSTNPSYPSGDAATINNAQNSGKSPIIQNLHARFTAPGQSVSWSFYTWNDSPIPAYLKQIEFLSNALTDGTNAGTNLKECVARTGTSQSLVTSACSGISVKISVGAAATAASTQDVTATKTLTNAEALAHTLAAKPSSGGVVNTEPVVVTITYAADSAVADGAFDVYFGDIQLTYSSTAEVTSQP